MTGKILGSGVIKGEDGKRYHYDELKNVKANQNVEGLEVDFEVEGENKAIDVFITSKQGFSFQSPNINTQALQNVDLPSFENKWVFLNLNEAKQFLLAPNIHSLKVFALLTIALNFLPTLIGYDPKGGNFAFYFFSFLVILLCAWVNFMVFKLSQNSTPLKVFALSVLVALIGTWLLNSIVQALVLSVFGGGMPTFRIILLVLCFIAGFVLSFLWFFALKKITKEILFLVSFVCFILAGIFAAVWFGMIFSDPRSAGIYENLATIFSILANLSGIFAWLRFRSIGEK